ncbi:MAG: TatD family hydrolase [Actinomycetota bacterium]|nr:TatD family hydrolase [Actinomycetota bacterium]
MRVPALDSHCHMDIMDVPVRQILDEAAAVGITRIVQVGTDVLSSRWSAEQAETYDAVLATVAIHPNEAGRGGAGPEALTAIEELASRERVRGIGETGLDRYRTGPEGYAVQEASFRAHIDIAKRHGKALVIHDRDAHADVLRVLDEEGAPERTVFHCFSGDAEMARRCADRGYVMSFAGTVTFKNAEALREAARVAPLDLLLVETDAPFLTPMPFRGRPNAPYLIPHTLRVVAQIKSVDLDDLCTAVTATGRRMFD